MKLRPCKMFRLSSIISSCIQLQGKVLKQMHDDILLLKVLQRCLLWCPIGEHACHVRRYTVRELHDEVTFAVVLLLCGAYFLRRKLVAIHADLPAVKTGQEKALEWSGKIVDLTDREQNF